MLLNGTYRTYNTKHLEVFNKFYFKGISKHIELIDRFYIMRDKPLKFRYKMLSDLGIYRQTWDGHLALFLGAILHKL